MTELVLVSANQATGKIERSIEGLKGNDFIMNPNNTSGDMIANDPHQLKSSTQRVMLKKKEKLRCPGISSHCVLRPAS
ncbi:MAG TPA: hypothetical protein DCR43_05025 [Bacteroidales bacterium]|nr:MAG: hypothetical protein A2X11_01945 [Bacteroidetes bacterium GWE2_42_24]OFY28360.1 MAG: hypothetical protein A2X09_12040 [Bacteroidetes bacterium GWF2_43_11]HAQ65201.1 hypothetical protein [Bacteroidales bacterium]HBZ65792.1 hypothetical protein [Bacteroidales bacterium]